ncbi:MAG: hypothetical protein ACOC5E_01410 [Acidobacteriota bacterium]
MIRSTSTSGRWPGPLAGLGLLALLATLACAPPEPLPEEWTLGLEELVVIGEEPVTEETAFYRIADLGVDGGGRLYVLDAGNHRVQVFSEEGDLLASRGGRGDGPGELEDPEGLWVYPDGELLVADTRNRRVQRWGPAGDPRDPISVDFLPLDVAGTPDRLWIVRLPPPVMLWGPDTSPLVRAYDRDGNPEAGAIEPEPAEPPVFFLLRNTLRVAPRAGGGFAAAETHVNSRIRLYDEEGIRRGEIPVLYKMDAHAPLGHVPELVDDASLGRLARTCMDLEWDAANGVYWVLAGYVDRLPDDSYVVGREIYRYAEEGSYRGSIMLPHPAVALAVGPDRSFWTADVEGVVRRYRLTDPDMAAN